MHFILSLLYLGDNTLQEKYYGCRPRTAEVADMYTCVITCLHGMTTTPGTHNFGQACSTNDVEVSF